MERDLEKAIAEEAYERAAELRDAILKCLATFRMNPSILERKERWAKKMAGQRSRVLERPSERLPPGQHLTSGFPVLDLGIQPDVSIEEWSLELSGEVEEPIKLVLEGILSITAL